ncbi:hypothetical protein [Streptomyces anulatus]|uniref:hypothetical protein n=1 Tax=Streptomyces anulatus TaxID=1892 RepID=UPI0036BBDE57
MQKIPTLFVRNPEDMRRVLRDVTPGCEWVPDGEGQATRKWDGTCVMLDEHGAWWARREVKPDRTSPTGYRPVQHDEITGKTVGWEPMEQSAFARIHAEAVNTMGHLAAGTYELIGPKINRNSDEYTDHVLLRHGWAPLSVRTDCATAPRDFEGLQQWLTARPYEGIVWHHPDGRMAKLKARDFTARHVITAPDPEPTSRASS